MGSVPTARKYTYAVMVTGVLGVLAVALFVWNAGRRIEEVGREDLEAEARSLGTSLEQLLVATWADLRVTHGAAAWERFGGPLGPRSWEAVGKRLPDGLFRLGDLKGVVVRTPTGTPVWHAGRDGLESRAAPPASEDGLAIDGPWGAFWLVFWGGAGGAAGARVSVYLDQGRAAAVREDLTQFIMFGLIAISIGMYVLAAVTILLNRAQTRLLRTQHEKTTRLNAIGEVAGGIAHEVRNPLNAISLSVQYMQKLAERGDRQPSPQDYARIHLDLGRIRKVVDSFVKFARIRDMVVGTMDLGEVMDEALKRFAPEIDKADIRCEVSRAGDLQCSGDREKILEVFAGVLRNAIDAMRDREGGELRVRLAEASPGVKISVRDSGEITDETAINNIFEPSFGTRDSAMGLGMTVARTFVESHGGSISAAVAQGGGCVVTIELPRRGVG